MNNLFRKDVAIQAILYIADRIERSAFFMFLTSMVLMTF